MLFSSQQRVNNTLATPLSKCEQRVKINVVDLRAKRLPRVFASENIPGKGSPQPYSLRPPSEKKKKT